MSKPQSKTIEQGKDLIPVNEEAGEKKKEVSAIFKLIFFPIYIIRFIFKTLKDITFIYKTLLAKKEFSFYMESPDLSSRILSYLITIIFFSFIFWAAVTKIDERAISEGQVIPSSSVQNIQSFEGGILQEMKVKEGAVVKKGQILLKLSDIRFSSTYEESKIKFYALQAKLIRLETEISGKKKLFFSKSLQKEYPDLVKEEISLFKSNKKRISNIMESLQQNEKIIKKQYNTMLPLVKESIVSELDLLNVKKELNEIRGKITLEKNSYMSQAKDDLVKTRSIMNSLKELLHGYKDRLDRTVLKSPVYGIVKKIYNSTVGETIKAGESIIEIVPLDDELLIEGKILPNDIAFIKLGQKVDINVSSYDSSIYGTLEGELIHISADTILDKDQLGQEIAYYKILIKAKDNVIKYNNNNLPIIPGMQVVANIITGERTILQYLLKPIIKTKQNALGER